MDKISRRKLLSVMFGTLGAGFLGSNARAHSCWDCRMPSVDMPVSLGVGTVRTPEFVVKRQSYLIMIRVMRTLPFAKMNCMMGGPFPRDCDTEPLLQAEWKVWDDAEIIASGYSHTKGAGASSDKYLDKYLGRFVGVSHKKYVLEVKFTTDGSALNVTDPHLIVMMTKQTDI